MELNEALCLRRWMPLSQIGKTAEPVFQGFFRLGANIYARTQVYNKNLELNDPLAPFLTAVYWATSLAALKRAFLNDESPVDTFGVMPPKELLIGTSGLYSELLAQIPKSGNRIYERAEYSNKGLFQFKELNIDGVKYLFFNNKNNVNECVSIIEFSLITSQK
ncbi:hypothetical protein ACO0LF_04805 [Undibacterium sp. Di27W]|uniref:hypothetical protein n=1 Tax=Undibacterium sp. Di27W TaxID=3413036 RepID=UPI003BF1B044